MTNKEKKKILKQFAQIDRHIEILIKERDDIYSSIKTSRFCDIPGGAQNVSMPEQALKLIGEMDAKLNEEIERLLLVKTSITDAIYAMRDITERDILLLHYIGEKQANGRYKQLYLWQIANVIGYSLDTTNHKHGEALTHINLKNNKL